MSKSEAPPELPLPASDEPESRPRRRRGRPPRESAADEGTRDLIVSTALEAFSRRGFDGVSLSQIAGAAGVSAPLIHYYFDSKEQLWQAALSSIFDELHFELGELEPELAELDPLAGLEAVIRRFVHFAARHPEISVLLRRELGEEGPRMEWLMRHHWQPARQLPLELIAAAQATGRLRAGAPDHLLQIVIGACLGPLRVRPSLRDVYGLDSDAAAAELHAELVVTTLFRGLCIDESSTD